MAKIEVAKTGTRSKRGNVRCCRPNAATLHECSNILVTEDDLTADAVMADPPRRCQLIQFTCRNADPFCRFRDGHGTPAVNENTSFTAANASRQINHPTSYHMIYLVYTKSKQIWNRSEGIISIYFALTIFFFPPRILPRSRTIVEHLLPCRGLSMWIAQREGSPGTHGEGH